MTPEWKPSRREQRADWWLKRIIRSIGAGGVVYTAFIHPNGAEVIVFGAMGAGLDIGQFVISLARAALQEMRHVGDLSEQESERESKD